MHVVPKRWQLLAACVLAASAGMATAQSSDANVAPAAASKQAQEIARGDPARWYREDATPTQQMRTRRKEIGAALDEAKHACRRQSPAERAGCLKAAQDTWKQDMAALRSDVAAAAR